MKRLIVACTVAGLAAFAAPALAAVPLQIHLNAQNGSGESGTATLLQSGPNVIVRVRLTNAPADAQPAHIHKGTCDKLDPKPAYPLKNLMDGFSESTIPGVTLKDFATGKYAINVHKSTKDLPSYVACGDIVDPAMMKSKM